MSSSVHFVKELANKEHDWYTLGRLLKVPRYKLDSINKDHRLDGETRCLIEVFDYLDKDDQLPTWDQLVQTLRSMQSEQLAEALATKYCTSQREQEHSSMVRPPLPQSPQSSFEDDELQGEFDVFVDASVSVQFQKLIFDFSRLLLHVKRALGSNATPQLLTELQLFMKHSFGIEPLTEEEVTFDRVFNRMDISFLEYYFIEPLIQEFAHENKELLKKFQKFEKMYKKFEKSTAMKDLKTKIVQERQQLAGGRRREVRLKMKDVWNRLHLNNFKKLIKNIVSDIDRSVRLHVTDGCLCVTWEIASDDGSTIQQPLALSVGFMRAVGIISFSIGRKTIYDSQEDEMAPFSSIELVFQSAVKDKQMEAACVLLAVSDDPVALIRPLDKTSVEELRGSTCRGWNMLHFACDRDYDNVVEAILITEKIPCDSEDYNGWTPLMVAINSMHIGVAKLMITKACVNAQNKDGTTPLYIACQTGQAVIVNDLLRAGAMSSLAKKNGMTPLMIACQNGHVGIISLLMERGVELNAQNEKGETAVNIATLHCHSEVTSLLASSGANLDIPNDKGYTPLMNASAKGIANVVDTLIEKANVNSCNKGGLTPLHLASQHGYTIIVAVLLSKGANPLSKLKDGSTPLLLACSKGHGAIVNTLLSSPMLQPETVSSLVEDTTNDAKTGLYYASRSGSRSSVEALLKRGANPNVADQDGSTPLMAASYKGFKQIVELLLKNKTKVNPVHAKGSSALYLAVDKGHTEVVDVLLKHGADPNVIVTSKKWTPLIEASAKGHTQIVNLLLQHRAKVNEQAIDGSTALHMASLYGHKEIVSLLIEADANVLLKNRKDKTPHDVAVSRRHNYIARMLDLQSTDSGVDTLSTVTSSSTS